jgi:hypothetical protein
VRVVAVLAPADAVAGSLAAAMLEDVVDLVAEMQQVQGALVTTSQGEPGAAAAAWPGMPVLVCDSSDIHAALTVTAAAGAEEAAVVCADVPDLPALLLGKLFSALTSVDVAVCPADTGELVAVASKLPVPPWLVDLGLAIDAPDALSTLRRSAPRRALHVGSGWHRTRTPDAAEALDPGLEGWEATRAWLAATRRGS